MEAMDTTERPDADDDRTPQLSGGTIRVLHHPGKSDVAERFAAGLEGSAWTVESRSTDDADEVGRLARRAVDDGVDVVGSVGGDGSANLVLAALDGGGVPLLIIPAGTVNLTATVNGVDSVEAAVEALVAGHTVPFDLGADGDERFAINASSGVDAAIIGEGADHSDAVLGRFEFARAALHRLREDRPRQVRVVVDGEVAYAGRAMSVIVMNVGQRASASLDVAPDARTDDGLLDLAVARISTLPSSIRVVVKLALGRPTSSGELLRRQGRSFEIDWDTSLTTQRDGDAVDERSTLRYDVRPGAIRLVVPPPPA